MHLQDHIQERADLSPATRRLGAYILLTDDEVCQLEELQNNRAVYSPGETIIEVGATFRYAFAVRRGVVLAYRISRGGRRQIITVYLPGDFVALQINFDRRATMTYSALGNCELALIEPARLLDIYASRPVLAAGLEWASVWDYNVLAEHNFGLGVRSATQRVLAILLELWCRLRICGEADESGMELPLTQQHLADICGISLVHTNKSLQRLRDVGLLHMRGRHMRFPDPEAASEYADFDASFMPALDNAHREKTSVVGMSA